MPNYREARIGDRVRVQGGPFDERTGRVLEFRSPDTVLFQGSNQPITGESFLKDKHNNPIDYALVQFDGEAMNGLREIGVPVKRLKVI